MQMFLGVPEFPHFSETELYSLWNAAFSTMIMAGR
jgi:hypothetical protein